MQLEIFRNEKNNKAVKTDKPTRTLQDVLVDEGMLAVQLASGCESVDELRVQLLEGLAQNSEETRTRYANSVLRWYFRDGLESLAARSWKALQDEATTRALMRAEYLEVEPIMSACVCDALFPVDDGLLIPGTFFDRFLKKTLGGEPPANTRKRLKMNLVKLGFLTVQGKRHRLNRLPPTPTALIIILHQRFAPNEPRTVELKHLFADPSWKHLGYKSEDEVRAVLKDAQRAGLLAKYVVADRLEQVTTCLTLDELLRRNPRL